MAEAKSENQTDKMEKIAVQFKNIGE